ncbi:MAG TPA: dTDP-glucose 4,6-dehydratase [Candidatus Kryptonia bacterium]|nr:dTDP-glucose 4,6-dehydratase [Candidatus Kryptonia bacterium]
MQTMIVTGGAGFIGSNFVRLALAQTAARVVVFDKLTYAGSLLNLEDVAANPRYTFVKGDIAERTAVQALYREYRPTWVVNFAAESHVDRSIDRPRDFVDTNVVGTFELLDAARGYVAELADPEREHFRFLHVSTDEVYGTLGVDGLFSESTPYAPNSPYAASKAAADHFARAFRETFGLPLLITNCSNNYGPYQFPEKLIPLTLLNAIEGKRLPIYGDGQNVRDWLYVEDHCDGILLVLQTGKLGEKYNIGGHTERTNVAIVDRICDVLEEVMPAAQNSALRSKGIARYQDLKHFVPDRPGHDRRYAIDAAKIRRELGWQPRHTFESGIAATVRWYVQHRDWCDRIQAGRYQRERLGLTPTGRH